MIEVLGVALEYRHQGFHDLLYGLVELRLTRVSRNHAAHKLLSKKFLDWTHGPFLLRFGISINDESTSR
jgi:hypothetical protein